LSVSWSATCSVRPDDVMAHLVLLNGAASIAGGITPDALCRPASSRFTHFPGGTLEPAPEIVDPNGYLHGLRSSHRQLTQRRRPSISRTDLISRMRSPSTKRISGAISGRKRVRTS